jgi:hypothetical protein
MLNKKELKREVIRISKLMKIHKQCMPSFYNNKDLAHPCIDIIEGNYVCYFTERGVLLDKFTTSNLDKFLYYIFEIASSCSSLEMCSIIPEYRELFYDPNIDQRIIAFSVQEKMMGLYSEKWKRKCKSRNDKILKEHP